MARKKQKRTKAREYYEMFLLWRQERLENKDYTVESRSQAKGPKKAYKFTKKELLSIRQCYTNDVDAKYLEARQQLPEYWFVSEKGTLLTCRYKKEGVCFYPAKLSGSLEVSEKTGQNTGRQQYEISAQKNGKKEKWDGMHLDPATLVALTFDGNASAQAQELIEKHGLLALKKDKKTQKAMVELNHIYGYKHGNTEAEIERNRAYNCNINNTGFLTYEEHQQLITNAPGENASAEKKAEYMKKLMEILPMDRISMVIINEQEHGKQAGDIKHPAITKDKSDNTWFMRTNGTAQLLVKGICAKYENIDIELVYEDGSVFTRDNELLAGFYDECVEVFKTHYADKAKFGEFRHVGDYLDKKIFAGWIQRDETAAE